MSHEITLPTAFRMELLEPLEDASGAAFGDGVLAGEGRIANEHIEARLRTIKDIRKLPPRSEKMTPLSIANPGA